MLYKTPGWLDIHPLPPTVQQGVLDEAERRYSKLSDKEKAQFLDWAQSILNLDQVSATRFWEGRGIVLWLRFTDPQSGIHISLRAPRVPKTKHRRRGYNDKGSSPDYVTGRHKRGSMYADKSVPKDDVLDSFYQARDKDMALASRILYESACGVNPREIQRRLDDEGVEYEEDKVPEVLLPRNIVHLQSLAAEGMLRPTVGGLKRMTLDWEK